MARKRTPLEQFIAEQTDKRAAYNARQREKGLIRTNVWVPVSKLAELKAFALRLCKEAESA